MSAVQTTNWSTLQIILGPSSRRRPRVLKHHAVCTLYTISCSNINLPRLFFFRLYCHLNWRTHNHFVLGQCPLDAHLLRIIPWHECVEVTAKHLTLVPHC
jgi:hypothetical protein